MILYNNKGFYEMSRISIQSLMVAISEMREYNAYSFSPVDQPA
jgi:hypothetical protein